METSFNGLGVHLGNLWRLSAARTRSLSAENPTGAKGQGDMATAGTGAMAACELGPGWKISPCINVPGYQTVTLADITGPGAIQHIWLTVLRALGGAWSGAAIGTVSRRPRSKCRWAISSAVAGACTVR